MTVMCYDSRQQVTGIENVPSLLATSYKETPCIVSGFVKDQAEQELICFNGAQDPIFNTEHANPVNRNQGQENCILQKREAFSIGNADSPTPTGPVTTCESKVRGDTKVVCSHSAVRRLTPLECERLMGFPDGWTKIPFRGKSAEKCPDAPRYKACGNSMCVNVMQWIGERIEQVERLMEK